MNNRLQLYIEPLLNDTIAVSISKSDAMMQAKTAVESLLYLRLPMSKPSSEWWRILVPCNFYTKQLEDTKTWHIDETIIYLSTTKSCSVDVLAFANICTIRQRLAGFINMCSNNIDFLNSDNTKNILVHEIFHSLGFVDFENVGFKGLAHGDYVIDEARRLFDCPSMTRAPLLNMSSHWDKALVSGNEVMSKCVCIDSYISSLTIAAMVDTGRFYAIDNESQEWRGGFGCDDDKPERKIRFDDGPCSCFRGDILIGNDSNKIEYDSSIVLDISLIDRYDFLIGLLSSMFLSAFVMIVVYIFIKVICKNAKRNHVITSDSVVIADVVHINHNNQAIV